MLRKKRNRKRKTKTVTTPKESLIKSRENKSRFLDFAELPENRQFRFARNDKTEADQSFPKLQQGLRLASWFRSGPVLILTVFLGLSPLPCSTAQQVKPGQPYALIFGTVWGPDDRPVYGIRVKIRRSTDKPKKVRWELYSDHHGEFAQRVPAGEADYIVSADLKGVKFTDGTPAHLAQDVTVHVYNEEREDIGLHLTR